MKKTNRLKKKIIIWMINTFFSGTHWFSLKRFLLNQVNGIKIGEGTKIVGPLHIFGSLSVGNNTWIGREFCIEGNGSVSIGSRCDLGPMVSMFTGSHQTGGHNRRAGTGVTGSICVGDGCWIGGRSSILLNTTIGDGVVVAAGAVVNKSVEPDCLVAGIPATVRKKYTE